MKPEGLNRKDRVGILIGTALTFLLLPISLMMAAIPAVIVADSVSSPVLALSIKLGFLGFAAILTFLQAVIAGLATSYFLSWIITGLHLRESLRHGVAKFRNHSFEIEACQETNYGALIGGAGSLVPFVFWGATPIHSLTSRVEHLFPGPLMLSLGNLFQFDLSQVYAAATGFLAVGFLFAIAGIVLGSLCSAVLEFAVNQQR